LKISQGARCLVVAADVGNEDDVVKMMNATIEVLGGLDVSGI
jgi:NAD(P)-dependent dehydrogenase (short-subunit alcohol dehydrogenase family)